MHSIHNSLCLHPLSDETDDLFVEYNIHGNTIVEVRKAMRSIWCRTPQAMRAFGAHILSEFFFDVLFPTEHRVAYKEQFKEVFSNTTVNPILLDAFIFAEKWHADQTRKDGRTPYMYHPIRIAHEVFRFHRRASGDKHTCKWSVSIVAAALLHDTVEDTDATFTDISERFPSLVLNLVFWLTDLDSSYGNRETRKALSCERLYHAPYAARLIKYFDVLDNIRTSATLGDFRQRFFSEKADLLHYLFTRSEKEGEPVLANMIQSLIYEVESELFAMRNEDEE